MSDIRIHPRIPKHVVSSEGEILKVTYTDLIPLKPIKTEKGYLRVEIEGKRYRIHRLVAECFIPNPLNLPEINHKDANKANNRAENLEWCSHKQNMVHAEKNKRIKHPIGEKHGLSRLKENEVRAIRSLYQTGKYSQQCLAEKFNCCQRTIAQILNNLTWKHI